MADRPDGSAAGTPRVAFTKPAAERIAKVVRKVEAGSRDGMPWSVSPRFVGEVFRLRVATFTGSWETGTYKTVTLTNSGYTASVYNWCNASPLDPTQNSDTTQTRFVVFGKAAGRNTVVEIQTRTTVCDQTLLLGSLDVSTLPGFNADAIQLLGHSAGDTASTCTGGLRWYSVATCSTSA